MTRLTSKLGAFGDSADLDARYVVCVKRTIGLKIVLDTPDVGHVESHFFLFGDSVGVSAR